MKSSKEVPGDDSALRRKVEESLKLDTAAPKPTSLSPDEVQAALHELQVHQIELEMQNEELRRTQEELDASRDSYFDLYDMAPVGYFTVGEKGLILEGNLTTSTLLGVNRSQLAGKLLSSFILKEDQDIFYLLRKQVFVENTPQSIEIRMIKTDGTTFWALLEATAKQNQEGGPSLRIVMIDITERKRAEDKIKASLAEKEVILKEIHHRVKNNMQVISSLLQLQASKIKDPAYAQMFKDSQERIKSMALVYDRLNQSEDMARIELRTYVSDLVGGLVHSYSVGPMTPRTVIDVADIHVSLDLAIPCGLIINEVISNSLKYAFPGDRQGTISVSIKPGENMLDMSLADDGVGLPEGLTFENAKSLGMTLVKTLVGHQLGGKLELKRENGTEYDIRLPWVLAV